MKRLMIAAALGLTTACGGDDERITAQPDAGDDIAPPDAGPSTADDPAPRMVPLSGTGADGFNAVVFAPDGSFFAAGYAPATSTDRAMAVAKFTPDGELDTAWGVNGVAVANLAVGGKAAEAARAIVRQSTGAIVIAGPIEADVEATGVAADDRDVGVARFDANGFLDATFDGDGIFTISWNEGLDNAGTWVGADDLRHMIVDDSDRLLLHGAQLTTETGGGRIDTDWVMMRLTADGAVDTTFNPTGDEPGRHTLDILDGPTNARVAHLLPDGSILGTGYANTSAFGSTQPVVYKLTSSGTLDTDYGTGGYFHEAVLQYVTEIYGVTLVGDDLVTAGYGRDSQDETNDWVSLKIDADGALDPTWGDDGMVRIDFHELGDNGRQIVALPGERVALLGSAESTPGNRDPRIVVLEGDGVQDADFFGDGRLDYDFGGPSDAFWGGALAPDSLSAIFVGTRGQSTQTAEANDDGAVLVVPLD